MKTSLPKIAIGIRAALLVAFAAFALVAPSQLGGNVTYVATAGRSMAPAFHTGDLVLVRRAGDYKVGDVVAYHSRELGKIVLHRIVAHQGDRFVFKGDNNSFVDPERPTQKQFAGRLWLHVPKAAGLLVWVRRPTHLAGLAALLVLLLAGGKTERRRRRRRSDPRHAPPTFARLPNDVLRSLPRIAVATLAAGLALAALGFVQPSTVAGSRSVDYTQSGAFRYSARVRDGAAFGAGQATSGQPIYVRQSDDVAVGFTYRFASDAAHALSGTAALDLTIANSTGWSRTVHLRDWTRFDGDSTSLRGTFSLRQLRGLTEALEASTGVTSGTYFVSVDPRVSVRGKLGGRALDTHYTPTLSFTFDANQLQVSGSAARDQLLNPEEKGRQSLPTLDPAILSFAFLHLRVARVRILGLALLLLGALLGLVAFRARAASALRSEVDRISARYGAWIVPVERVDRAGAELVELSTIEALARVAERYDRMILHRASQGAHAYHVIDDGVVHVFRIGGGPAHAPDDPPGERVEIERGKGHLGVVRRIA